MGAVSEKLEIGAEVRVYQNEIMLISMEKGTLECFV